MGRVRPRGTGCGSSIRTTIAASRTGWRASCFPGWKVLDIGGGSGVLALPWPGPDAGSRSSSPRRPCGPTCGMGSSGPGSTCRSRVVPAPWEDVTVEEASGFDLAVACNSLHLTRLGTRASLERIVAARPERVFVASELDIPLPAGLDDGPDTRCRPGLVSVAENSFRYHSRRRGPAASGPSRLRHGQAPSERKKSSLAEPRQVRTGIVSRKRLGDRAGGSISAARGLEAERL
ncbi:MAG: hypothetical protein MZU79_04565 [Anaerotruncus sp.]|nr:hypothetical protein [Anaerotruncus sp.]